MKSRNCVGRPRCFDPDEALDQAMRLFWARGYEGTSLSDLTEALGVSRPSLYATFGNKEELFRLACERYESKAAAVSGPCLNDALTGREAVGRFLEGIAESAVHPEHSGCMLVTAGLATGTDAASIREGLEAARNRSQAAWRGWLMRAQADGRLSDGADVEALARFVMTVAYGMSVQARSGAGRDELLAVARQAMAAWPD